MSYILARPKFGQIGLIFGQIGPKWDKSRIFLKKLFQYILDSPNLVSLILVSSGTRLGLLKIDFSIFWLAQNWMRKDKNGTNLDILSSV